MDIMISSLVMEVKMTKNGGRCRKKLDEIKKGIFII
jgi:hypothetical protein